MAKKNDPDAWRKAPDAPAWAKNPNRDQSGNWILPKLGPKPKLPTPTGSIDTRPRDPGPNASGAEYSAYLAEVARWDGTTSRATYDPVAKSAYDAEMAKYNAAIARRDKYKDLNSSLKLKRQNDADIAAKRALDAANLAFIQKQSDLLRPDPPPPTTSNAEVQRSADQARLDAMRRRGFRATRMAGDTGGYTSSATGRSTLGGTPSLLG